MTASKHNLKMREVMKRNYYENGGRERKQIKYYKTKYNLGDAFFADCKDHSSKLKKVRAYAFQIRMQTLDERGEACRISYLSKN